MLQLAGQTLWEKQAKGKSLQWAKKAFKIQAKSFYVTPKSPLLFTLYEIIRKLGKGILWWNKNKKQITEFWVGLIFLAIVTAVLIAFTYGAINFDQIKSFIKILLGQ